MTSRFTIFLFAIISGFRLSAAEYYVAVDGNDADDGSADQPWATFAHAVSVAMPGDTIVIAGGIYHERLIPSRSGKEDATITYRAAQGEQPVLDGSSLRVAGRQGMIEIRSRSYLRIEGLTVKGYRTDTPFQVPVGILIEGKGEGLEIVGNTIESMGSTALVDGNRLGRDAHGIGVFGTQLQPLSAIVIRGNTLRNLTLGSSEALVINGNVDGFQVLGNVVIDCDNIGIDAIGFEDVAPAADIDQARNGIIARNRVERIQTKGNPAYTGPAAAGIYIDGGRDIVIERNWVSHCDIGIEVASEHAGRVTHDITVRSNLLVENLLAGLFIGGYNSHTTGDAENCRILHNTFYNNDTDPQGGAFGQLCIQYRVRDLLVAGNIFVHTITKDGNYNIFVVQWNDTGRDLTFERNLYYGTDTPVWVIANDWTVGWDSYLENAQSGVTESWGNPAFVDAPGNDFTLATVSPAIGLGYTGFIEMGELDFEGNLRLHGDSPDAGALEYDSEKPVP